MNLSLYIKAGVFPIIVLMKALKMAKLMSVVKANKNHVKNISQLTARLMTPYSWYKLLQTLNSNKDESFFSLKKLCSVLCLFIMLRLEMRIGINFYEIYTQNSNYPSTLHTFWISRQGRHHLLCLKTNTNGSLYKSCSSSPRARTTHRQPFDGCQFQDSHIHRQENIN